MLIDARHREETRVVVQKGKRLEDFEFESATRRQLKGNIYLAKVTRVEPSLQAAFVDYGGNRHGFLPFSEIHPDYYQIPAADKEALLAQQRAEFADDQADEDEAEADEGALNAKAEDNTADAEDEAEVEEDAEAVADAEGDGEPEAEASSEAAEVEEAQEKIRSKRRTMRKRYKIQEVIKKRQILLVQIVKEERGNKGAAATTYLSLAGRYCVLMPNSTHGGGISRKISSGTDRKRLRSVMDSLNLPDTMGGIIRTAGMKRTKTEIERDFDYLTRLWEGIREATLKSIAPTLIHEEGNLIKRAIRDLYTRDIEEVIVDGEEGYKVAKSFMKMLMPSHARRVLQYKDPAPLFQANDVDAQLQSIMSPTVQMRSGGYLVINPTEALVSIDVNSGKSTKEHNIEETAVRTNLEAADEVARQLRLRDMAGLVVIDFIDMEDRGNNRAVERRMKDALKDDRARVQVGRISQFGLMEMSRQRLRPGMLEATTMECPMCHGTGIVRNVPSASLQALRAIEADVMNAAGGRLRITLPPDVGLYLLNEKRELLIDLETRNDVRVEVLGDRTLATDDYRLERIEYTDDGDEKVTKVEAKVVEASAFADDSEDGRGKRKRRRRGRGRGKSDQDTAEAKSSDAADDASDVDAKSESDDEEKSSGRKRKRRGRRGGRKSKEAAAETATEETVSEDAVEAADETKADAEPTDTPPKRRRVRRKTKAADKEAADAQVQSETVAEETTIEVPDAPASNGEAQIADSVPIEEAAPETAEDAEPAAPEPVNPDSV
ncbi:MAG: ribonuclease E/G [Sphingomonadales bacterium]